MASGECLCLFSGQILFLFVCSLCIDTSVVDISRDEDDDSFVDDRKVPAKSSPKRRKVAKPADNPGQDFKARTVHQLTGHMCEGSPASQQAAMSALDNLSSSSDNLSKMIIKSSVDRGSTSIGMSQDAALKLIQAEKLRHKRA
jgi:hypothetical protein